MSNTLYEKTGIKLTQAQTELFKVALRSLITIAVLVLATLVIALVSGVIDTGCIQSIFTDQALRQSLGTCLDTSTTLSSLIYPWLIIVYWVPLTPFIVRGVSYISRLVSDADFREKEMAESVNFLEEDEREQMITMRATRRAYMVLNFTLLVFWIFSLFTGDIGTAFTLFIVQAIGAISYKRQISK